MPQPKTFGMLVLLMLVIISILGCTFTWMLHYLTVPVKYHGDPHPLGDTPPFPGPSADNLWWFVQISDIHITTVADAEKTTRLRDFRIFCQENLKVIKPSLVIASGDLTDGAPHSSQNEEDWISYQSAVVDAGLPTSLTWLDIRGNHDNFNVPHPQHPNNYYRKYSVLGEEGDSSFLYQHQLPFGMYSFIYIGAYLKTGIKRPMNFFGVIDQFDMMELEVYAQKARQANSNQTVFFGHYPSSVILSGSALSDILQKGIAYLCGHLHDLDIGSGIKRMHVLQRYGSLELELEDWRKHRMYRVLAFDHDMLSFIDVPFGEWPIVLITNPKSAQFLAPHHEPIHKMINSTHIRFLVFSVDQIHSTEVKIDHTSLGLGQQVDGGPLFVIPWKPALYTSGLHRITVKAKDVAGRVKVTSHQFSLDESRPNQSFLSSFPIMINAFLFFGLTIIGLECCCIVPLIFLRRYSQKPEPGPWFIGEIMDDNYGIVWLYGVFVDRTFVNDKFAMYFFIHDLLLFHIPVMLFCIIHLSRAHFRAIASRTNQTRSGQKVLDIALVIISLFLLRSAVGRAFRTNTSMHRWYGIVALILSPKYTWTFCVAVYVCCRSVYVGYSGGQQKSRLPES